MPSSLFAPLAIEIEYRDRRPAGRSDSDERPLIDCPLEVSVPSLLARMKEVYFAARDRIDSPDSVAFGEIARGAGEGSIREGIRAFSRPGLNVLEMKLVAANRLRRAAVLTAKLRPSLDLIADLAGEGHFALALSRQRLSSVSSGVNDRR
jgi:hypothetical protein